MLCPEVWNFATKKNTPCYQMGIYDKKQKQVLDKALKKNVINEIVSVILPNCERIPAFVDEFIKSRDYYLVKNLNLCDLVRRDFVEAFIKRGKLTGISLQPGICNDFENTFFVSPDGKLHILINKDLYQVLGLEGRPVGQPSKHFEITIDLKNNNFLEQPKLYKRIKNALSNPEIERCDFQLAWEPIDASICPSSIAKFFNDSGYKVEQHSIQIQSTRTNTLKMPNELFSGKKIDGKVACKVAEYFAFIMLECDMMASKDLNSYRPMTNLNFDGVTSKECLILHFKGLISLDFVAKILEKLRLSEEFKSVIFAINGNEKLPIEGSKRHTFVIINDKKYFFIST